MLATLGAVIDRINSIIWGPPMITLIFGLGIYFTFKLAFIQKLLFKGIYFSVRPEKGKGEVSSFGALAVTIAATVGTGSIIGVTTAIAKGGPGAIFWMVFAGIFNFAIKYAECFLSIKYRTRADGGEYVGGPMYVMRDVLKYKKLAVLFAVGILFMAATGGSSLQASSIAEVLRDGFLINPWISAIFVCAATAAVVLGGVKRIASYCEWLVPLMGGAYLLVAIIAVCMHLDRVFPMIWLIIESAFTGKAAIGGAVGVGIIAIAQSMVAALEMGVTRSVLATESALGSAPIVAAAAKTKIPAKQALISATSVFWTILICFLTGIVILLAGDWQNPALFAADLTNSAFKTIPYIGTPILVFSLTVFSFTTIIGWAYYGEKAIQFLTGNKWIMPFRIIFVTLVFIGGILGSEFVWGLRLTAEQSIAVAGSKVTNLMWGLAVFVMAFLVLPNIYATWKLRDVIKKDTLRFIKKIK